MKAKISIDLERDRVRFDRMIFGQFLEHFHRQVYGGVFEPGSRLSDRRGFRKDVIEAVGELRVPIVRWPGGCFASDYHWLDGVGPKREGVWNKPWRVEDPNTFGTNEFVTWCKEVGTEPYLCTNEGTGTHEEASFWVEYCNMPDKGRWSKLRKEHGYAKPHNVKYWSVGNENYHPTEVGARAEEEWPMHVVRTANMMKRVDENIQLVAPSLSTPEWMIPLLDKAGQYLSFIAVHLYSDGLWRVNNPSDYLTCMTFSLEAEELIRRTKALISLTQNSHVNIAIDEWNLRGWHHPSGNSPQAIQDRDKNDDNSTYTMADALFSAVFLNTCLRHAEKVKMANMAPLINTRGPLFVHPKGIVKRTTFHVMKMYSDMLEPYVVDAWNSSNGFQHKGVQVPALDMVATCDENRKKLVIAMVNRHDTNELECEVIVNGIAWSRTCPATLLSGDSVDAYNDVRTPDRVVPNQTKLEFKNGVAKLPPHSLIICEMTLPKT